MHRWLLLGGAIVAVASLTGCGIDRGAQARAARTAEVVTNTTPVVQTQLARSETVTDNLEITGDITTGEDTIIGAKQTGKITAVYVKEGDTVAAGQLLASLDTSQLQAQLQQANAVVQTAFAGLRGAISSLAQARKNAAAGPQKSTAALMSAQAQLRSAQAQLAKAKAGARPEEIAQDEAAVASAKKDLEVQQRELQRVSNLVSEGAIAANRLDQQQNVVAASQSRYDSAQQQLMLARAGARSEDIVSAQESVREAQESVNTAKIQKSLDPLLMDQVNSAQAAVASSKSQLDAARAAVAIVVQQIEDMQIRAPFAGRIAGKPMQAGVIAGAGTQIARIIGGSGVYFNGDVPSTEIDNLKTGQSVKISIDGLPGKSFAGLISSVSPIGENIGRLFTARVAFVGAPAGVRPGMFAHGSVLLKMIPNATLVPIDAVVTKGESHSVFYVEGQVAKEASVTTGLQKGDWIQVVGLPANVQVVIAGQDKLRAGRKVLVKSSNASAKQETGKTAEG